MADFASLGSSSNNPFGSSSGSGVPENALGLTVPGSILTGMSAGVQYLGGSNLFADSANSRLGVQQGGTPQVLMGKHPTLGQGFFVSKPGVNVVANTDPSQFIFNSAQDVFKIVGTGTITSLLATYSSAATNSYLASSSTTAAHNLGYVPAIIGYALAQGGAVYNAMPLINVGAPAAGGITVENVHLAADNTNVILSVNASAYSPGGSMAGVASGVSYTVKYYLLQETAN